MTNRNSRISIVPKTMDWGVWVWVLPSGKCLANTNGDYLSMNGKNHDINAMAAMRKAAAQHGFPEGRPMFVPGRTQVTQSEWEDQIAQMQEGGDFDPSGT